MKRRIVQPRRVWLPARNESSKAEEKGRVRGGWGRRPREIAGAKEEGERPGRSRSQPVGLDREAWVAEAPGPTGVEPEGRWGGGRRRCYLTQMHVLLEGRGSELQTIYLIPWNVLAWL